MRRRRVKKGLYEPFLINPHRMRKRTITKSAMKKRKKKKNEMAMIVGNPRKKGGVTGMAKKKRKKNLNPKKKKKYNISRATRRRGKKNPILKRRRWKRNPLVGRETTGRLATILTGAASAILVTATPDLIKAKTTIMKYGSRIAVAFLGSWLVGKMLKSSEKAFVWGLVGSSVIMADLLKTYVLKGVVPGLGEMGEMGQYYYLPAPSESSGYYAPESEYSVVPSGPFEL